MNELKRCLHVFTLSPFQVRLKLLNIICDLVNGKPQEKQPSQP